MAQNEWAVVSESPYNRPASSGWEVVNQNPIQEKQSAFRQVADVPLGIAKGAVQGVRMIADAFGAGSNTSNTIKSAETYLADLMSAQAKNDQQEISRIMKDAEDKGVLDQVKAAVKAFTVAPVDTLSSALGTAAPVIAGALGAKILGAGALLTTGVSALTGAGMGAGVVKGSIYEETKRTLKAAGASEEEAERRAQLAQEYGGKNLDQILLGTVLGGAAAVGPLEKGAAGILARRILGKTGVEGTETVAEQTAKGALRRRAEAGLLEAVPEAAQAGQEKVAENVALQREGFDVPTFRGVAGAATLEAIAGGGLGATLGGGRPQAAPAPTPTAPETPVAPPTQPPVAEAPVPPVAPPVAPVEAPAPVAPAAEIPAAPPVETPAAPTEAPVVEQPVAPPVAETPAVLETPAAPPVETPATPVAETPVVATTPTEGPDVQLDVAYGKKGPEGSFLSDKTFLASGSESDVFRAGNSVYKITEPYNDKSEETYQARIRAAQDVDQILGDGTLKVSGFYLSPNGTKNPVFQQEFIEGRPATREEIRKHMESRGFAIEEEGSLTDTFSKIQDGQKIVAKDLDGDNVKVDSGNKVRVIDGSIIKTPIAKTPSTPTETTPPVEQPKTLEEFRERMPTVFDNAEVRAANEEGNFAKLAKALQRSTNPAIRRIGQLGSGVASKITLKKPAKLGGRTAGRYTYDDDAIQMIPSHAGNEQTNAHETLHALISKAQRYPTERQKPIVQQIDKLYEHVKRELKKKGITVQQAYGLKNAREFTAEAMTNPEFQFELMQIPYPGKKTAWTQFVKLVADLLGIQNTNALTEVMNLVDRLAMQKQPRKTVTDKGLVDEAKRESDLDRWAKHKPQEIANMEQFANWSGSKLVGDPKTGKPVVFYVPNPRGFAGKLTPIEYPENGLYGVLAEPYKPKANFLAKNDNSWMNENEYATDDAVAVPAVIRGSRIVTYDELMGLREQYPNKTDAQISSIEDIAFVDMEKELGESSKIVLNPNNIVAAPKWMQMLIDEVGNKRVLKPTGPEIEVKGYDTFDVDSALAQGVPFTEEGLTDEMEVPEEKPSVVAKATAAAQKALQKQPMPEKGLSHVSPELTNLAQRIFFPQNKTILDRIDSMKDRFWQRLAQGTADQFRTIKEYSPVGYMQARLSKSIDGSLEGLLFHGQVFDDGGALNIKANTKGMMDILKPIGAELDSYLMWVALNRESRLPIEKRSNIPNMDKLVAGRAEFASGELNGKPRVEVYQDVLRQMNQLNKSVLDVALAKGLIDQKGYDTFSNDIYYIPFYKKMEEDGTVEGAKTASGLTSQEFSKELKGSEAPFGDLMENIVRNWSHILSASMKNAAAQTTLNDAMQLQAAEPNLKAGYEWKDGKVYSTNNDKPIAAKFDEDGKQLYAEGELRPELTTNAAGMAKIMVNGQPMYFKVTDELLMDSISSMGYMGPKSKFTLLMRDFKNMLQYGVTASPIFKVNNLIRDSVSALAVSDLKKSPVYNVMTGISLSKKDSPTYISALAGGAIFNFGSAYEGDQAKLIKRLLDQGVDGETILDSPDKIKKALKKTWEAYQELGNRSEAANRLSLYQQMRDKGLSHLQASFMARDLLDFSMQGSWETFRFLTQVVPFMNARIQGLYKLGRDGINPFARVLYNATTGKEITANDKIRAAQFSVVTAAVGIASALLYLSFKDDEDFKKRDAWDRDNFWWFKIPSLDIAFRIPKPFEVGAFGTLVERTLEQIVDEGAEGKQFGDSLWKTLWDTFSLNPTPQIFKPLVDIYANKDSFSGAPIESAGLERLSKQERRTDTTSPLAIALGGVSTLFPEKFQVSPVQMDYAIKGYFGWLGAMASMASTYAVMPFKEGEYPDARWLDRASLGLVRDLPAPQSAYVTAFYENAKEISQAYADMRHYREIGDAEKVQEILEEKGDKIMLAKFYDKTSKNIANVRKQIQLITNDKNMDGAEKKEMIERMKLIMSDLAKQAEDVRKSMKP